ncbi:TIGR02996 domain-containing protein [Corallococcus terminator]
MAAAVICCLGKVLENPADDEARAVLADALLEEGHPRGELIALQLEATRRPLTHAEKKRERDIIKTARKELLGPLDAVLKVQCRFTRGFLSHAALKQSMSYALSRAQVTVVGHPLWATVEHLEGQGDEDITPHPVMKSLRSLAHSQVHLGTLAELPRLEALVSFAYTEQWSTLAQEPDAFPRLRRLDLSTSPQYARDLLTSPLAARLKQLQLRLNLSEDNRRVAEASMALFSLVPKLKVPDLTLRLVLHPSRDWCSGFRFLREPSGRHSVHVFTTAMKSSHERLAQADVLSGLERAARLKPAKLTVAHRLRTNLRRAVEQRTRELGGTLES